MHAFQIDTLIQFFNFVCLLHVSNLPENEPTRFKTCRRHQTANLSRLVSSPTVQSVSEKCWLLTYCLDSFLACCALQSMQSPSAHSCALCKNGTRKYKNETVIPMISVLCQISTARRTPYVTQSRHMIKQWR